jgi:hypothetical protein
MIDDDQQPNAADPSGQNRLQYWRSYAFIFDSPAWVTNILFCTLCQLIPLIGPVVVTGYLFEIIEALHRGHRGGYPDFTFDRFTNYLLRGLWPSVITLLISCVMGPLAYLGFSGTLIGSIVAATNGVHLALVFTVAGVAILVIVLLLSLVFVLLCGVGGMIAMSLSMLAQGHLLYQLYEISLTRGCPEIPLPDADEASP